MVLKAMLRLVVPTGTPVTTWSPALSPASVGAPVPAGAVPTIDVSKLVPAASFGSVPVTVGAALSTTPTFTVRRSNCALCAVSSPRWPVTGSSPTSCAPTPVALKTPMAKRPARSAAAMSRAIPVDLPIIEFICVFSPFGRSLGLRGHLGSLVPLGPVPAPRVGGVKICGIFWIQALPALGPHGSPYPGVAWSFALRQRWPGRNRGHLGPLAPLSRACLPAVLLRNCRSRLIAGVCLGSRCHVGPWVPALRRGSPLSRERRFGCGACLGRSRGCPAAGPHGLPCAGGGGLPCG